MDAFSDKWVQLSVAALAVAVPVFFFLSRKKTRQVLDPTRYVEFTFREKITMTEGVPCPVFLFRFDLPHKDDTLGLPIGQHISLRTDIDGKEVSRSYTPTSTNDDKGYFDLVVKVYPQGAMSQHLNSLKPGDKIKVKGPSGRFEYKKNQFKKLGMIAGGTGITPMLQVAKEIVKHADDKTEVSLIYANVTESDIILKEELDRMASTYPNFKVFYTLDKPPQGWTQGTGFVTKDMIQEHLPAPADGTKVIMCGPPPMMKFMKQNLEDLGFDKSHIFTF